ncbi:hypothetical protein WR25_25173 isoform A [Diploscapter pachys]|uniref:G-protein coupled receptors family 1 profile domain-containing protein n=1 Tax=Diploscapter pachys TaxID=2018661 RepID=A0A2A2LWJ0_9BILA|nr:hypothetical protein WR25_25173 isoform A [Diploscapter pachys]
MNHEQIGNGTMEEESNGSSPHSLQLWIWVSRIQVWIIPILSAFSIVVILKALHRLVHLKRSNYYLFLLWIIIADLITLIIILITIFSETLFTSFRGATMCKILLFSSNTAACFVNWTWLMMFAQRCIVLFFPLKRSSGGVFGFVRNTKKLLLATAAMACLTQSWSLLLVTERIVHDDATICERDTGLLSDYGYRWIAVYEAFSSYVLPFFATIVADLAVIVWQKKSGFTLLSSDNVRKRIAGKMSLRRDEDSELQQSLTQSTHSECFKIQSSQSIKATNKRRQRAIRRCLIMATVQVILNGPYYTLQLLDEVYRLSEQHFEYYLYADAFLYLIYLCQFPMIAVYLSSLVGEVSKKPTDNSL